MNRITIFITGGARSGKSSNAENLAEHIHISNNHTSPVAYLATGEHVDKDFSKRIADHIERRGNLFKTYEEPLDISDSIQSIFKDHKICILECITTWLGNIFHHKDQGDWEPYISAELENILGKEKIDENTPAPLGTKLAASEGSFETSNDILTTLPQGHSVLIIVSNEIGSGLVPVSQESRTFRDIHGRTNSSIAHRADFVYHTVAGQLVRIK